MDVPRTEHHEIAEEMAAEIRRALEADPPTEAEMAAEIRRALEADPPTEAELRAVADDFDAVELRRLVLNLRPDVRRVIIRKLSHLPDGAPDLNSAEVDLLFSCLFIEAAGM